MVSGPRKGGQGAAVAGMGEERGGNNWWGLGRG